MTDKEKIIKELKEVLDNLDITNKYRLNLIRAIEYLQEEPASEDLEEAADSYIETHGEILGFGKQTFKDGAKWQKQQMMAKAVEGGCFSYKNGFVHISCDVDEHLTDVKFGDKVKVIVIKED